MNDIEEIEKKEEKIIDEAFQDLLDCYLASKHRRKVEIITKAFNFAKNAHKGVAQGLRDGGLHSNDAFAVAVNRH